MTLFLLSGLVLNSCKKDDLKSEKYAGTWNYQTSQGCQGTMFVKPISDNTVEISWSYCMLGKVKADILGNSINIPSQISGYYGHQGSGTITENSIQFNAYRFTNNANHGYWIMKVTGVK